MTVTRARGNCDLDRFSVLTGKSGEQRLDQARQHDIEPVGRRSRLGAAIEQGRIRACLANVEVNFTVIFDVAVDSLPTRRGRSNRK